MTPLKIKKESVVWLWMLVALPLVIAILDQFKLINLTPYIAPVMVLFTSIFVFIELGYSMRNFRFSKKPFRLFGLIVLVAAVVLAFLALINVYHPYFATISGIVNTLLVIYVVIVAFTK